MRLRRKRQANPSTAECRLPDPETLSDDELILEALELTPQVYELSEKLEHSYGADGLAIARELRHVSKLLIAVGTALEKREAAAFDAEVAALANRYDT